MKLIIFILLVFNLLCSCGGNQSLTENSTADEQYFPISEEQNDWITEYHVITGQTAVEEVVGKFDGVHMDTLYIESESAEDLEHYNGVHYYLCSKSGRLPKIELYGCDEMAPLIYEEGDLDGNGTDDMGYLHTWTTSQWRYYRILTFHEGQWFYMFDETEDFLNTNINFRHSGKEIAKSAKEKGKVCITYMTNDFNHLIKDTIVTPKLTEIGEE